MEESYSFDDTLTLRPRSKDFLRVKSEDLNYNSGKTDKNRKDSKPEKLQNQQRRGNSENATGTSQQLEQQAFQTRPKHFRRRETVQNLLGHRQAEGYSANEKGDMSISQKTAVITMLPHTKASICSPSALLTKQQIQRKHQQRLTRQSVVEESTLSHAGQVARGGGGRDSSSSGGEILDRVEQLTRQLVRVCGGRRNDSVDMGEAGVLQINVPNKTGDSRKKSANSGTTSSFMAGKRSSSEKNMGVEDRDEEGKKVNIQNLDVVEAPLKAFFLRNRGNTCSLRGGKKITGAPGEEAAGLASAYTEEEKYPWGKRLEDAPWISPIYSIRPGHRQRCTRCLTYFHFTVNACPETGGNTTGVPTQDEPQSQSSSTSQSMRSKRAQLHKMKSFQTKWEARKGQLQHTRSAPLSSREESIGDSNRDSQLRLRQSWAQYGQHSYDSRVTSAGNDDFLHTPENVLPPSNFLRPPLSEGEGIKLRETEARRLASQSGLRDSQVYASKETDEELNGFSRDKNTGRARRPDHPLLRSSTNPEICEPLPFDERQSECPSHSTDPVSIVIGDAFPPKPGSTLTIRSQSFSDSQHKKINPNFKPRRFLSMREHHTNTCPGKSVSQEDQGFYQLQLPVRKVHVPEVNHGGHRAEPGHDHFTQRSCPRWCDEKSRDISPEILGGPWVFSNVPLATRNTVEGE